MSRRQDAAFAQLGSEVAVVRNPAAANGIRMLRRRLFRQQLEFIDDPERHKSLRCPRRAGKSYAVAVYMLLVALQTPGANVIYIAKTRDKAREILWELLISLNRDFALGFATSEVHTALRAATGSRIRLRGCETLADVEALRGEPFHLVVIDEAASYNIGVLESLINRAVEPTLGDYKGTLVLTGTPGHILAGPWYRASGPNGCEIQADGTAVWRPYQERSEHKWDGVGFSWSGHHWSRLDNVAMPHLQEEAQRIKQLNGWADDNPIWRREFLGLWVPDGGTAVYRYNPERNRWRPGPRSPGNPFGLPGDGSGWHYVAGMDFGTKDPFALQVVAYHDHDPRLFHCYEFTRRGLLPPGFAEAIRYVQGICDRAGPGIEWMVGDFGPYGDLLHGQMVQEYGLAIEKAEKRDKRDHIDLLNGDFEAERCFILEGSDAEAQMLMLTWDAAMLKEQLSVSVRNDATDALVYTWRRVQHHWTTPPPSAAPVRGTPQWEEDFDRQEVEAEVARARRAAMSGDDSPGREDKPVEEWI